MKLNLHVIITNSYMKRLNLISSILLLSGLFFVIFLISCGKKDGAPGPVGPAGPIGPAGPAGPKGDASSSDSDVIYSDWLDVPFAADTFMTRGGGIDTLGYYAVIDVPKLTSTLLGTADIKVYINSKDASDPVIYSLPFNAISGLNIEVSAFTQGIQLYSNGNMSTYSAQGKKYQQYRYMIVPGNIQARLESPVNWSDYASVKAYLGLKD